MKAGTAGAASASGLSMSTFDHRAPAPRHRAPDDDQRSSSAFDDPFSQSLWKAEAAGGGPNEAKMPELGGGLGPTHRQRTHGYSEEDVLAHGLTDGAELKRHNQIINHHKDIVDDTAAHLEEEVNEEAAYEGTDYFVPQVHGNAIKQWLMKTRRAYDLHKRGEEGAGPVAPVDYARLLVGEFMEKPFVQATVLGLVVLNSISIGVEVEQTSETRNEIDDSRQLPFLIINTIFLVIFFVECAVKLFAYRRMFFSDHWNVFDFVIVAASSLATILHEHLGWESAGNVIILRLMRVMRIVRLVEFLGRLAVLVSAFIQALRSVVWVALLMFLFMCALRRRARVIAPPRARAASRSRPRPPAPFLAATSTRSSASATS